MELMFFLKYRYKTNQMTANVVVKNIPSLCIISALVSVTPNYNEVIVQHETAY